MNVVIGTITISVPIKKQRDFVDSFLCYVYIKVLSEYNQEAGIFIVSSELLKKTKQIDIIVGSNCRFLRNQARFSQADLANELGITFQQVQKYEKGSNRIAVSTMYKMSKILEVGILDFFKGLDPDTNQIKFSKDELEVINIYRNISSDQMRKEIKSVIKRYTAETIKN